MSKRVVAACVDCGQKANGKYGGPCATCGAATCPKHTYFYADESNAAITASALPKCRTHAGAGR